jgi:hypothetical protein
LELLRPRRDPLLLDVDARGAEGALFVNDLSFASPCSRMDDWSPSDEHSLWTATSQWRVIWRDDETERGRGRVGMRRSTHHYRHLGLAAYIELDMALDDAMAGAVGRGRWEVQKTCLAAVRAQMKTCVANRF